MAMQTVLTSCLWTVAAFKDGKTEQHLRLAQRPATEIALEKSATKEMGTYAKQSFSAWKVDQT